MGKQITPGVDGAQIGMHDVGGHASCSKKPPNEAALDPEHAEDIRGFAEHIVSLLCARHNGKPQDDSGQTS